MNDISARQAQCRKVAESIQSAPGYGTHPAEVFVVNRLLMMADNDTEYRTVLAIAYLAQVTGSFDPDLNLSYGTE